MSNETLSLPTAGGISLASLPVGSAAGDVFQWDGSQWQIVPNDNNNPLILDGLVGHPAAPVVDSGKLYKVNGSDGLWWVTDGAPALDVTLAAAATTDVPLGLNVFTVNSTIPAVGNNYATVQAAILAAEALAAGINGPCPVVLVCPGTYVEDLTISGRIIVEAWGDASASQAAGQSVTIDGTLTVQNSATVKNIRFIKTLADGLPIIQLGAWLGAASPYSFNLIDCRVLSTSARAVLIDWSTTTGVITCRLGCFRTLMNVNTNTEIMFQAAGENRLLMLECRGTSGAINFNISGGASGVLTMQDCSHTGFITIAGNRASLTQTVVIQGGYRFSVPNNSQPWFRCTGNNHLVSMENIHIRMPTGGSNAIEFTGTGCQFERSGLSFDRSAAYGQMTVSSVSALTTINNDAVDVAQALRSYTVNPSAPIVGNNYATIQAAINVAEAYAVANPTLEQPVVLVAPGVYNEALTISRNIILSGQGASQLYNSRSVVVDSLALGPCVTLNAPCTIKDMTFDRTGNAGSRVVLGTGWNIAVGDTSMFINCTIFGAAVNVAHTIDWSDATIANRSLTLKNTTIQATSNTSNAVLIGGTNFIYMLDGTFGRHSGVIQITSTFAFPLLMDKMDWNGRIHLNNGGGGASTLALLNSTLSSNAAVPCIYDSSNFGTVQLQSTTVTAGAATAPINLTFGTNLTHDSLRVINTLGREPVVTGGSITQNDPTTLPRDANIFTVNPNVPNFNNNFHTIQAAVLAAEATLPSTVPPRVVIQNGEYTENVTVSGNINITADNHEATLINGTFTLNSNCSMRNLRITAPAAASAIAMGAAYPVAQTTYIYDCVLLSTNAAVAPTIAWNVAAKAAGLRLNDTSVSSASVAWVAILLQGTNGVLTSDCGIIGILQQEATGANSMQVVRGSITGSINIACVDPGVLSTKLHIVDCRVYNDGGYPAISCAVDNIRIISDNCDYLILDTLGCPAAINITGTNDRFIACGTTFSDHPNQLGNLTNIIVSSNDIKNETEGVFAHDVNVYTVNPNMPLGTRNFATIQAAIDATTNVGGDPQVIQLAQGTYVENITVDKTVSIVGFPGGFNDVGFDDARKPCIIDGTVTIATRCTFENIGFSPSTPLVSSAIVADATLGASSIHLKNCRIKGGFTGAAYAIDWSLGAGTLRLEDTYVLNTDDAMLLLTMGGATSASVNRASSFSGQIVHASTGALTIDGATIYGAISLTSTGILLMYRSILTSSLGAVLLNSATACTVLLDDVVLTSSNPTNLVNLSNVGSTLVRTNMSLRSTGANTTKITCAGTVVNRNEPSVPDDLNIYTVNPNVPQGVRNFHTIQTAVNAAEAALPTNGLEKATIHVTRGNYQEDVTISKRVELIGVGAGAKGYYQSSETGDVEIQGTVYANSPCVLENIIFNPGLAAVPLNASLAVGLWLTDTAIAPYNEADSVVCTNCMFVSNGNPGYCITNTTNQTNRNPGKRAQVKLYDCLQDNAGLFANLSNGNVLFMFRSSSTGNINIDPVQGFTGNTAVLVAQDSTLQQLGAANPTISIAGTAQAAPISNINLLRCRVTNSNAAQVPIDSALDNVMVVARSTEITTGNANAIRLSSVTGTEIQHYGLWSGNTSVPTLVANTVTPFAAIV